MTSSAFVVPKQRALGVLDIPLVLFAPRRLFAKAENVNRYGSTLLVLLVCFTLVGYASIETGLIDREVQKSVALQQAELEKQSENNVVARSDLIKQLEEAKKLGEFKRLTNRILVVAARPLGQLAMILLTASLLYGAVALTGRKPEWHTLMTICVFASFADLVGEGLRLALMVRHATMDVDTSAALLLRLAPQGFDPTAATIGGLNRVLGAVGDPARPWWYLCVLAAGTLSIWVFYRIGWRKLAMLYAFFSAAAVGLLVFGMGKVKLPTPKISIIERVLGGIDPFDVWFWLLIVCGLSVTTQLKSWRAWVTCGLFWMVATGVRVGLAFATGGGTPPGA